MAILSSVTIFFFDIPGMLLKPGTGNREPGTGNRERETGVWERVYSGFPHNFQKPRAPGHEFGEKKQLFLTITQW